MAAATLVLHGRSPLAKPRVACGLAAAHAARCRARGHQLCVASHKVLLQALLHVAADTRLAAAVAAGKGPRRAHHAAAEAARANLPCGESSTAGRRRLLLLLLGVDAGQVCVQGGLEQWGVAVVATGAAWGLDARAGGGGGDLAGQACSAHSCEGLWGLIPAGQQ